MKKGPFYNLLRTLNEENREDKKRKCMVEGFEALSLDEQLKVIRSYNEENNTNYTYGYFKGYLRIGRINLPDIF